MISTMERICGIIDLDGYELDRVFHTREAAFSGTDSFIESETYRIPRRVFDEATPKQRRTIGFITRRIIGLPFFPGRSEDARPLADLRSFVEGCYRKTRTESRYLVAYKGGHYERDLLGSLDIPCVNMEDFGCPRYDDMTVPAFPCVAHRLLGNPRYHCPLSEVHAFRTWLVERISEERGEIAKPFDGEEVREVEGW